MTSVFGPSGTDAHVEERFRSLFHAHYSAVVAYTVRRLGRTDGQDAAAEVFAVAWRRMHRVPSEPEALPWLYGVARNVVRNTERSRRRRERLASRAASVAVSNPTPTERNHEVLGALERLRAIDREILLLSAWEGLEPAEIAPVLGISAGTASVRLHRARQRLAELLRGDDR